MTPHTLVQPLPFAVTWADPADQELLWRHDAMHFPDPLAPIEVAMLERTLAPGLRYGTRAYHPAIERVEVRAINGYQYQSIVPISGAADEMAAQGVLAEAALRAALARLDELCSDIVLPEIRAHLVFWETFDLERATRGRLAAHLNQTWPRLQRIWELHFVTVLPAHLAMSEYDEMHRALFCDADAPDSRLLLEGLPDLTGLEDQIGRGRRADKWTILTPGCTENPMVPLATLRDFVRRPESDATAVTRQAAADERERAVAAARARLRDHPAQTADRFEDMLAAAQAAAVVSEQGSFWIGDMLRHLRAVLLAAGRRLVDDGAIAVADEVFMLEPEELRAALVAPGADLRPLVDERLAQMRCQRQMQPPPVLGTMPAEPPPDDPFTRLITPARRSR